MQGTMIYLTLRARTRVRTPYYVVLTEGSRLPPAYAPARREQVEFALMTTVARCAGDPEPPYARGGSNPVQLAPGVRARYALDQLWRAFHDSKCTDLAHASVRTQTHQHVQESQDTFAVCTMRSRREHEPNRSETKLPWKTTASLVKTEQAHDATSPG